VISDHGIMSFLTFEVLICYSLHFITLGLAISLLWNVVGDLQPLNLWTYENHSKRARFE